MANGPRVLVTSGRFPPTTGLVAALHRSGARVDAVDSYKLAPALHAHATEKMHVVPGPADDPVRFARAVADIVRERSIDLVTPPFKDGFFLARYRELVPAPVFAPSFATLAALHNKSPPAIVSNTTPISLIPI